MRASKDGEGRAAHCVSAVRRAFQNVIDHTASRGRGTEIPGALELLDRIDLMDEIVTGDANLRQKAIAENIIERGDDEEDRGYHQPRPPSAPAASP